MILCKWIWFGKSGIYATQKSVKLICNTRRRTTWGIISLSRHASHVHLVLLQSVPFISISMNAHSTNYKQIKYELSHQKTRARPERPKTVRRKCEGTTKNEKPNSEFYSRTKPFGQWQTKRTTNCVWPTAFTDSTQFVECIRTTSDPNQEGAERWAEAENCK